MASFRSLRYGAKTWNAWRISFSAALAIFRSPRSARSRARRTADTISSKMRSVFSAPACSTSAAIAASSSRSPVR
jgi:hypothetical protein